MYPVYQLKVYDIKKMKKHFLKSRELKPIGERFPQQRAYIWRDVLSS